MKKTKLLSFCIALLMLLQLPLTALADAYTYSPFVKSNYTQQSKMQGYKVVHGLDLSYHNGDVDFAKLKKAGVSYVILRVGYRGYGAKGTIGRDKLFDTYYQDARKQGLDIGVYFYSQAISEKEAIAEAEFTLERIKGLPMDMPVYYDYEFAGVSDGRLDSAWRSGKVNKASMTANTKAFCNTVRNAGYMPGIYASASFFYDNIDHTQLEDDNAIWVAHYTSYNSDTKRYRSTTYKGDYEMWQYSAKGTVSGTDSEYVDSNFMYKEVMEEKMGKSPFSVEAVSSKAYTGKAIKPTLKVSIGGEALVAGSDYYITYKNNVEIGKASATVTGINDYEGAKPVTVNFEIVPAKVKNVQTSTHTTDSITFTWDKHEQASKYRVQRLVGTSYKTLKEVTGTTYTLTDLQPCEAATVRVAALAVKGSKTYVGKYSTPLEYAAKPAAVTGLTSTKKYTDSIKLQWTAQEHASYYHLYQFNEQSGKYEYFAKSTKNTYTVKDLPKNSKHKYKVCAAKKLTDGSKIWGSRSKALTAYTSPAKPTIKSAVSKSAKRIVVRWGEVKECSGYEIMWSTTKGFSSNYVSVYAESPGIVSKVLKTAQSNKTYYVRVRSYTLHGSKKVYSYWSNTLSVKVK